MSNGYANPTFASFNANKDKLITQHKNPSNASIQLNLPKSFKEVANKLSNECNAKYTNNYLKKNEHYDSPHQPYTPVLHSNANTIRKNLIKNGEKSIKKNLITSHNLFKSPSHKGFQTKAALDQKNLKDKMKATHILVPRINLNLHLKQASKPICNQVSTSKEVLKTPMLLKTNRSFVQQTGFPQDSPVNNSFRTDYNLYSCSEKNSIQLSSRKSSDFEQSLNSSHQEDSHYFDSEKRYNDQVISSLELQKENVINNNSEYFTVNGKIQEEHERTMKKSTVVFSSYSIANQAEETFGRVDDKSIKSSVSVSSSSYLSQKFKHYKKQVQNTGKSEKVIKLEHFEVLRQIGSGRYGKVLLTRHKESNLICALKSICKKVIRQEGIEAPFIAEVKIQMYLNHPNIVKLYGYFEDQHKVYLIMEYCSSGHMLKIIKSKHSPFPEHEVFTILTDLFESVSFMHCHGVIHRDLKPENVVVEQGVYKLCDFGWAAYACGNNRTTFCGTPLYVSPEILKGGQYNSKTDVWGLGVIAYELAFGRVPFSIINQNDMAKIVKDPVVFPHWPNVSEELTQIIKNMLSKNPNDRPTINQLMANELFREFFMRQKQTNKEFSKLF